ncbi:MAG TPA: hypothetical protein VM661_09985 [Candidatus Sulfotelmatobacter sp.]|jgi:hypothetical protein|nr:hypothetical protein [Candidatus Sulfotelmatobacter sp.]
MLNAPPPLFIAPHSTIEPEPEPADVQAESSAEEDYWGDIVNRIGNEVHDAKSEREIDDVHRRHKATIDTMVIRCRRMAELLSFIFQDHRSRFRVMGSNQTCFAKESQE